MEGKSLRVLLVEDNEVDAELLGEMFGREKAGRFLLTHVPSLGEALTRLATRATDIVLLDLKLPDSEGMDTVRRVHEAAVDIPIIVLTGMDDEDAAAEAIKEGAQDYLVKGQIEKRALPRALRYAVERHRMLRAAENAARETTQRMAHLAQHDYLTDLPNRLLLNDRIAQAVELARRYHHQLAVLFLDADGFKDINDSLGHAVGDKLLQSMAKRLVGCVRRSDSVSRHGGDEFVVLLTRVMQAKDAAIIAGKLIASLDEPHILDGHSVRTTVSVGIAVYPEDGQDSQTLIRHADAAMYHAKSQGRKNFQFFQQGMDEQLPLRGGGTGSSRASVQRNR